MEIQQTKHYSISTNVGNNEKTADFNTLSLCSIAAYCQRDSDFYSRAKAGMLSYDECSSVTEDEYSVVVPSFLRLKDEYSTEEGYDGEKYNNIILLLNYYYTQKGDVAAVKRLLKEAGNTFNRREAEPNNKYIRNVMVCRGQLEFMLKNYGSALAYFNKAHRYFEQASDYGEKYVVMLFDMALAYAGNGNLLSAKLYVDEGVDRYEELYGSIFNIKEDRNFIYLADYGYVCFAAGYMDEAEKCFLTVLNNCQNSALSYEAYSLAANNLANIYIKRGMWNEAVELIEKLKSGNGDYNYMFAQNLCLCYLYSGNTNKAIASLEEMNRLSLQNMGYLFDNMQQLERENYWEEVSQERIFFNNLMAYHTGSPVVAGMAYDNDILCKNLLLNASRIMDRLVEMSNDEYLKKEYARYNHLKEELAYKANRERRDSLVRGIKDAEQSMLSGIGNLGEWIKKTTATWQNVRDALEDGEVAVEFCYAPHMFRYPELQPHYGAFVLKKGFNAPVLVSLGNVNTVEDVFYVNNPDALFVNELYSGAKCDSLYDMLWSKLEPYLQGAKKVYYSPTGPLANINFDVLRAPDGTMLNDRYTMVRLSSTSRVAEAKAVGTGYRSAALYGNVDYDESLRDMAERSAAYGSYTGSDIGKELAQRSENERGRWVEIPSAGEEIASVGSILGKSGVSVKTFEGQAASEESFKAMSGQSPDIIHLATHGFFIETKRQAEESNFFKLTTIYSPKESGMMWTGLVLAGGNNVWQGKMQSADMEDGVLTADEISRLRLDSTKLVVLSACQTGRGSVDAVDGVYGLQRAFKMAGAGTVVMSLWRVHDSATSLLMTRFYTHLAAGEERHKALWKAMMDVRKKYRDPYYWAGFVMLD